MPEDNPAARPKRRQFSADYKLAILEEYERITEDGGKGALLRREGLYSSHIVEWQRARDVGALTGLAPKHRKKRSAAERELDVLRRRNAKLEDQLARHRSPSRPGKHRSSWRSCWRRALRRPTSSQGKSRRGDRRVLRWSSHCSAPRRPVRLSGGPGPATTAG